MTVARSVLFGVPIDGYTMAQALDAIDRCIRTGRAEGRSHQVTTVNVDFLVNAITDPDVMALLQRADLNLADGMPVIWASRLLGNPIPERLAGADLVTHLGAESAARGWRVHLFGSGPGVARRAREILLEAYPDAIITADAGPPAVDLRSPDHSMIDAIRAADPDVLCVALGNPKQEQFIATHRDALRCPVMIGIGGSLDMIVGDKRRAPRWVQQIGAEWVFRAAQEPRRLGRRYARDLSVFLPALFRYRTALHKYRLADSADVWGNRSHPPSTTASHGAPLPHVRLSPASFELDLGGIDGLSPAAHADIVRQLREARLHGTSVMFSNISMALRTCFEDYGTWPMVERAAER